MGTPAAAQPPPPAREQRQRQVVLPSGADKPVPEVRVAAGVVTYLRFDAPIDRDSVEVEGRASRFRLVDAGERTLILEPSTELGATERLSLRVRYRDGAPPASVTLALVSHPTQVDKEVEVVRGPEALEAALARCEAEGPARWALSGLLDSKGVQAMSFLGTVLPGDASGLHARQGTAFQANQWALVAVSVRNLPGQKPWAPGSARLIDAEGTPLAVRQVYMEKPWLQPGETALVVVETEPLPASSTRLYRLELLDTEGNRPLFIDAVQFPGRQLP